MELTDKIIIPPLQEKICAVIVTYFPDVDFPCRLELIRAQVSKVVIIDNTPGNRTQKILGGIDPFNVCTIHNTTNLGLATAMNQGAKWALENGYKWALFLDQDTTVAPYIISSLLETYSMVGNPRVAIVGCNYDNPVIAQPAFKIKKDPWEVRLEVITSGSLISLEAWKKVGGFRETFFIDCVDMEFGFKCSSVGYLVVFSFQVLMNHKIGNAKYYHVFGVPWLKLLCSHHPPFRKYFIMRNQLILWSEYFLKYPKWVIVNMMVFAFFIVKGLLLEDKLVSQIRFIFLGIIDALMGKTDRKIV